ncbi:ABC transporter ATP-binding protein [Allorhizocola rhizosphaerae]|uniref:ABC transporter ATP-binding protein n=1 Tax=Allorhizocola rhizosphaerae TaxID=1872709 RepID=UPI000E3D66C9|nr:ABC transporter ATP-binding protein [Allorhizocola rhizosphaerae]
MVELEISSLTKRFGRVTALSSVDLVVEIGHLVAVLGPSGCGKTTLLRCVAGFERVDSGRIVVGGRDVTSLPPQRRRIAVVPQEGALFPHLSVVDNVAYGLPRGSLKRAHEVLALVGLADMGERMPHQLSGGQQQRVAVARALAPRPPVVLLDEPFSALDAALRPTLRRDIRAALRADGATALLVTHDQGEALSIADEVAVMREGRIVQTGPPTSVYAAPSDPWVAGFVGEAVWLPSGHALLAGVRVVGAGERVLLRPEQISVVDGSDAVVVRTDFHGHDAVIGLRLPDGTDLAARILGGAGLPEVGAPVGVRVAGQARAF